MFKYRILLLLFFVVGVGRADVGDIDQEFRDIDGTPAVSPGPAPGMDEPHPPRNGYSPGQNPNAPIGVKQTCMTALTQVESQADALAQALDHVRELLFVGKDRINTVLETLRELRRLAARCESRSDLLEALIRRVEQCKPAREQVAAAADNVEAYKAFALEAHDAVAVGDRTKLQAWRETLMRLARDRDRAADACARLAAVDAEIRDVVKQVHSAAWSEQTRNLIEEMRVQHAVVKRQLAEADKIRYAIETRGDQIDRSQREITASVARLTLKCPTIAGVFDAIKRRMQKLVLTRIDEGMLDYMDTFQEGLDVPEPDKVERGIASLLAQVGKAPIANRVVGDELQALYAVARSALDTLEAPPPIVASAALPQPDRRVLTAIPAPGPEEEFLDTPDPLRTQNMVVASEAALTVSTATDTGAVRVAGAPRADTELEIVIDAPLAVALLGTKGRSTRVATDREEPVAPATDVPARVVEAATTTVADAAPTPAPTEKPVAAAAVEIPARTATEPAPAVEDPAPVVVATVAVRDQPIPRPALAPATSLPGKTETETEGPPQRDEPVVVAVLAPDPAMVVEPLPEPVAHEEPPAVTAEAALSAAVAKKIRLFEHWVTRSQKRIECLEAGIREHGEKARLDCKGHRFVRAVDSEIEDQRYWIGVYGQQIRMLKREVGP